MKTRFYIGQIYEGKKIVEYTTNCARSEYYLKFSDGSYKIINLKK